MKDGRVRASFTVEAAFLFPILMLLIALCMNTAIDFYTETKEASQDTAALEEMDTQRIFWGRVWISDVLGGWE